MSRSSTTSRMRVGKRRIPSLTRSMVSWRRRMSSGASGIAKRGLWSNPAVCVSCNGSRGTTSSGAAAGRYGYFGLERQVANKRVEAVEGPEQALPEQILVVLGRPGQEHRVVV